MAEAPISERNWSLDGSMLTVRIPMTLRRRAGRKRIVAPDNGAGWAPAPQKPNGTLIRGLGRAHRWRRLLEDGTYATIAELSKAEKITDSYVSRLLQLTLLAPEILEGILDGKIKLDLTLADLQLVPLLWRKQREKIVG